MSPFAESTAAAALANLSEAVESLRSAQHARTTGGTYELLAKAFTQAVNAKAKLEDALRLEGMAGEMAVTNGDEEAA